MIWLTSDLHFFHENIIRYCDRPFCNAQEMNESLIKKFNQHVRDEDTVFFLGDLGMGNHIKDIIKRLNSQKKILILGNHDRSGVETYYNMGFSAVLETASIKVGSMHITMSHYPRKSLWAIIKLFIFYIRKMRSKNKTWTMIKQRLKREWRMYNNLKGDWHLHGHVHSKIKVYNRNIECGVDCWDFAPVSLKQILKLIDSERHK